MPTLLPRFTIDQPSSLAEAAGLLAGYGEDGRAYAGGTELLLAMKQAGLRYGHLVDLKTVPGLDRIEPVDGELRIGALATHRGIERSALVREALPALAKLAAHVANPRVRASGTLGGNLCFAEPHSDPATLLLCLGARLEVVSPDGERELGIDELIVGPYEAALGEGELLRAIRIPVPPPNRRTAYQKFQVNERPMLGLALVLDLAEDGQRIGAARAAIGAASPTPRRAPTAEDLLAGPTEEARRRLGEAADVLADAAELIDDLEGGADYKRYLVHILVRRMFEALI